LRRYGSTPEVRKSIDEEKFLEVYESLKGL
jgi:hypothetical protein